MLYLSTILTILAATSVTSLPLNINLGAFSPASIPPSPSRPVPYEIALRWSLVLVKVDQVGVSLLALPLELQLRSVSLEACLR